MQICSSSQSVLHQLSAVLNQLESEDYQKPLDVFSGASIGQHTRHILEFYHCIFDCDFSVNYDKRKRNPILETDLKYAIEEIQRIGRQLIEVTGDKNIEVHSVLGKEDDARSDVFNSSLNRELLYAYEHTVHHMAIIKIGLIINQPEVSIPQNFGVADSTVRHKESQCAQ